MSRLYLILTLGLLTGAFSKAADQPGNIDSTFDAQIEGGWVVWAIAVQPDGKVLGLDWR
jgi:hypothetical protein